MPLLDTALRDPGIRLRRRAADQRWYYEGIIPISAGGFNPFCGELYYCGESRLARWLRAPTGSARRHNERDFLVREALFLVHDYLHAWAYGLIRELRPRLGLGTAPITRANLEDLAFAHLVTEAVATVGLDYWYLCTIDLNEVCDLGSTLTALTVSYHDRHLDEYRRFHRGFDPQQPAFFDQLAAFYCTGAFPGFGPSDLRRSPRLLAWLSHELRYGQRQREYIRAWLGWLAEPAIALPADALRRPLAVDVRWKQRLIHDVGQALWRKVKDGRDHPVSGLPRPGSEWRSPAARAPDTRFVNLRACRDAAALDGLSPRQFDYYCYQFVSSHAFASFDRDQLALLALVRERRDARLLAQLFRRVRRVPETDPETRDLMFLN